MMNTWRHRNMMMGNHHCGNNNQCFSSLSSLMGSLQSMLLITEIICCAHMIISMIHAEATMTSVMRDFLIPFIIIRIGNWINMIMGRTCPMEWFKHGVSQWIICYHWKQQGTREGTNQWQWNTLRSVIRRALMRLTFSMSTLNPIIPLSLMKQLVWNYWSSLMAMRLHWTHTCYGAVVWMMLTQGVQSPARSSVIRTIIGFNCNHEHNNHVHLWCNMNMMSISVIPNH